MVHGKHLYKVKKVTFPFVIFHTKYMYLLKLLKKHTTTLYNIFICVVFVIHPLKIKRTVPTASTVHVYMSLSVDYCCQTAKKDYNK